MNEDWMGQAYRQGANAPALSLGEYTAKTFGWMFAGLMVTFLVAFPAIGLDGFFLWQQFPAGFIFYFLPRLAWLSL